MNTGVNGDVYKAALVGTLFGQEVVVTSYWRQSGANTSDADSRTALASAIGTSCNGNMAPQLSNSLVFNTAQIRDVVPFGDTVGGVDYTGGDFPFPGSVTTSVAAPPSTAVVTRKRTAVLGRKGRGRNYWPGVPMGSTSIGQLTSGAFAAWTTAWTAFLQTLTLSSGGGSVAFNPVIVGIDTKDEAGHALTYRVTDITSADVDPVLRQQRRREIGVGV